MPNKPSCRLQAFAWALVVALGVLYGSTSVGLVSSNDGSHVALARALLRKETSITPEVGLTLWVDRARRKGEDYSDRPPGTAFAALPALWFGRRLDAKWARQTLERLRAGADPKDVDALVRARPASDRYLATYGKRRMEHGGWGPNLVELQGTGRMAGLHAGFMGALGLAGLLMLLRRRDVDGWGQCFAVAAVGGASLWGPYSTVLFSHVTAGAGLTWCWWALLEQQEADPSLRSGRYGLVAGFAGAWAVSSDYALVAVVLPMVALTVATRPRNLWALALGAAPLVIATSAYHDASFGSPWAVGYDHHATFGFSRSRAQTFSGQPLWGLWTLWGLGADAGVLALAPVMLVAAVGLRWEPRLAIALLPWVVVLSFHQTPAGGAGQDHRYLVPGLALFGVGLGHVWQRCRALEPRQRRMATGSLLVLVLASAYLVWSHFFAWRG